MKDELEKKSWVQLNSKSHSVYGIFHKNARVYTEFFIKTFFSFFSNSFRTWRMNSKKKVEFNWTRNKNAKKIGQNSAGEKYWSSAGWTQILEKNLSSAGWTQIFKQFPNAWRLLSAALLERWPQLCRVKITFTKLLTNRFVSTTKNSMKYVVNWTPLRIRVRSRTNPTFSQMCILGLVNFYFRIPASI